MDLPLLRFLWVVACALVASAAAAQAEPPPVPARAPPTAQGPATTPPDAPSSGGPHLHLLAHVRQIYTSNLFHEQTRRLPTFETRTGNMERYAGMVGPHDFVTEPGLGAGVEWKLGKRRKLSFELGAEYAIHARNAIADYLSLAAEVRVKLGKRDSVGYEAGLIPKRFVKNYGYDGVPALNATYFARADRLELDNALTYRHVWTKRLQSEVGVALNLSRYAGRFKNRDANEYAATLASRYTPLRALELDLGIDYGITRTADGLEYREIDAMRAYIPVDRSHHEIEPHVRVALDLPARFAAALGFSARLRQFETGEVLDDTYYDRHDVRFEIDAELSKGIGRHFEVALQAGYQDNNAYRADPGDDADDFGYAELTVGLSLGLRVD